MLEEREREGNMKWKRRVEEKYKEGGREGRGGEWDREEEEMLYQKGRVEEKDKEGRK